MQLDTHNKHEISANKLQQKYEKEKAEKATLFRTSIDALAQSMEVALAKSCAEMARSLGEKERSLSTIFEELQNSLVGLEQHALAARHAQIEATQHEITQLLDDFERTLQCAEQVRQQHAIELIGKNMRETMDIRRGVPQDVLRSLADETKKISAAILRNREVYATIAAQLRMKALELDKQIDHNWSSVGQTWRILNYKHTIEKFKQALASGTYRNPPARIATLEALRTAQRAHHTRMLDQLHSVFRLTPPSQLTPTSVEEWQLALKSALLQAASDYKRATQTLRAQEDVMHTSCAELVAKLREDLREFRVVDDRDMSAIIVECRGLLDVRGRESLSLLAHVEAVLEVNTTAVMRACNSLCHYLTRVGALLEIQERECNILRTAHQDKLSQLHAEFTTTNKAQEEKLQQVISVMQGEVDDEELYRHLQRALDILRAIEEGYRNFCSTGVSLSVDYPNDTKAMLTQQQETICMVFGLTQDEAVWRASKKANANAATTAAVLKEAEQKEAETKDNAEKDETKVSVERRPKKKGVKVSRNPSPTTNGVAKAPSTRPPSSASNQNLAITTAPTTSNTIAPPTAPTPSRSSSLIIATAKETARRKSPTRRKRDEKDKEEQKDEADAPPPPPPEPEVPEKEPEEDIDVVTTLSTKYFILSNRPSLLHPPEEAPPAPAPPPPEPTPPAQITPPAPAMTSTTSTHRLGNSTRSNARRRPTSSRTGPAGAPPAAPAPTPPPPTAPPRTQVQEINDEIDRLKIEFMKGPLSVPIDPDGTPCLEMHAVPEALILYLEHNVRRSVINHIEGLFNTLLLSAIEEGKNSKKSFTADLEERLRLHRPRSGHIELEIYHQRAGALHAHRVRFDRHVQSISEQFQQECRAVSTSAREVQSSVDDYSKVQVGKIAAMGNANNTLTLQVLLREARDTHKNVLEQINTKVAELRAKVAKIGQSVVEENCKYTENMKKEGGGSSTSEIAHINSQLILFNQSVDAKCLQLQAHIDQIAQSLMRSAAAALQSLEAAHAAHHEDLTFLESINFRSGTLASKIRAEMARCERQFSVIDNLVSKMASPSVNELIPVVDTIRRVAFNRATYLDVLQSTFTITPNLLGSEISPLIPISALSFLPEGDAGDSAGEEEEEAEAEPEATAEKEKAKGRGMSRAKALALGAGGGSTSRGSSTSRKSAPSSEQAALENEEEKKERALLQRKKPAAAKPGTAPSANAPGTQPTPATPATGSRPRRKRDRALPFMHSTTRILRLSRKEAQQLCEDYYHAKGDRPVTRPNRIPATLPLLLQSLEEGFQQHEQATAAHRTNATKHFYNQMTASLEHLCSVPKTIFMGMANAVLAQCRAQQEQMEIEFTKRRNVWKQEREKLHAAIRPQMAHPNYAKQLETSAAQAQQEHTTNVTAINTHCDAVKRMQDDHATRMCSELTTTSDALLTLLDEFILPQDLTPGSASTNDNDGALTSMQEILKRMQSINVKGPDASMLSQLSASANPDTEKEPEKPPPRPKVKIAGVAGVGGDTTNRRSRLASRAVARSEDASTTDPSSSTESIRPFPKQVYQPLVPLPPQKEPPPATAPAPVQELKKQAAKNSKAAPSPAPAPAQKEPAPPARPPAPTHMHYATPAHEATVAARTQAYTQYQSHYTKALAEVEVVRAVLLDEEQRDYEYLTQALTALRRQHGSMIL